MGKFQSVEAGEELTVFSSQSEDCDLSCSVQLVVVVVFCPNVWGMLGLVGMVSVYCDKVK